MLNSDKGQETLQEARNHDREMLAVNALGRPPVQVLTDAAVRIWGSAILKPKPGQPETLAAKRTGDRLRQFMGAVVGLVMEELSFDVSRQNVRIPPSNPVFSTGSTFKARNAR